MTWARREEIYDIILKLAKEGVAVIVLSSEAQEVIRVCDRALVMYHGAIVGEVRGETMTEHEIMRLANRRLMRIKGEKTTMEKTNKKGFLAWFTDNWKRKPLFSTGIALLVMVILQILALGFDYASFGEVVCGVFPRNWINILRNNAGVGIIALGMTFVIISGGIDLAVGSTMVAIGAVVMSLIDGGPAGLLAGLGITGIPAFIIAIAIGILLGVLLGECTGVLVAHFGMPPFIATLGMMKICRSVTQQCMQKASPTVPKGVF